VSQMLADPFGNAEEQVAVDLATLAKGMFSNHLFLGELEADIDLRRKRHLEKLHFGIDMPRRKRLLATFREGLFLELRKLRPMQTDEGLELWLTQTYAALEQRLALGSNGSLRNSGVATNAADPSYPLNGLLPDILRVLAELFLHEGADGTLRVHKRLLATWQDLILVLPPLLISSAYIRSRLGAELKPDERAKQLHRWLCDSTLPVDDDTALDYLCRKHGLDEIHMHLNGSTEAEKVWADALCAPSKIVGNLVKSAPKTSESGLHHCIGSGVDRLLLQEHPDLTRHDLLNQVNHAAALRGQLLWQALHWYSGAAKELPAAEAFLAPADFCARTQQRIRLALPGKSGLVVTEAWYLCQLFAPFEATGGSLVPGASLWHYVLLRARFCRILVQQVTQRGFDQFQYITLNELRENSEKRYAERFRQFERGVQQWTDYVEGRFAPKRTPEKNAELIGNILRGYLRFLEEDSEGRALPAALSGQEQSGSLAALISRIKERETGQPTHGRPPLGAPSPLRSARRLRLGLVVHLIKKLNLKANQTFFQRQSLRPPCRHFQLRRELDQSAAAFLTLMRSTRGLEQIVRGVDAASNERHAGPEVFGPVFRKFRASGFRHFTYHAGEDFSHIIGGLRAMTEVMLFLDFGTGCRIGHGTAAGLDPTKWWHGVGGQVYLTLENRLDDLVFAREMLLEENLLSDRVIRIDAEISRLSMKIWQDHNLTPDLLAEAWRLRQLDPRARDWSCKDPCVQRRREALLLHQAKAIAPLGYAQFLRHHGLRSDLYSSADPTEALIRGQQMVSLTEAADVLDAEVIGALQALVLRQMRARNIAIETLPSANLRISVHERYEDHHIVRWLDHGGQGFKVAPNIVIGSDNPGIFATSLRHEYAHIARALEAATQEASRMHETQSLLEQLCVNSKRHRF
jgi:adenosine deaminase